MNHWISKLIFICHLCTSIANGAQNWYNLKLPFSANPLYGFYDQPRTVKEALEAGWTPIDDTGDCKNSNGGITWGYRYAPPGEYKEMLMIYDVNGFIAGMQSIVPKEDTYDDKFYRFSSSDMYNLDVVNGMEAYLTTAYFVDPMIICDGGRSQEDFDRDGTGNVLLFQNGPTPEYLEAAPLTAAEAEGTEWYKHNCFFNMGDHWFKVNYEGNQPCNEGFPAQLIFDHQGDHPLVGFVWQHLAGIKGDRWEVLSKGGVYVIMKNPPPCLWKLINNPGIRLQHVYLKDYSETC